MYQIVVGRWSKNSSKLSKDDPQDPSFLRLLFRAFFGMDAVEILFNAHTLSGQLPVGQYT